jgi:short-subunit dehydrogenase
MLTGMSEQRDFEGLSALATGATSGIGQAAAQELARHGAEVVVHGRDAARGQAVAEAITAEGGKARFVAADLSHPAELASSGLSNREIGDRLFLSPHTVSSHLYRSFPKLGVTARHQLRDIVARSGAGAGN